jgi:DNA-binding CsgD family transcriptional regulator/predicted negative regulator of RcsB-dependent stress response
VIREAVYEDLPAGERALYHERAAALLMQQGAPAEQVAAHLMRSPHRGRSATVEVLRAAGRTAVARGAADSAVSMLRRALEEPVAPEERPALLLELGQVEVLVDGPAAVEHLTEAYGVLPDARERARIAAVIARTHVFVSPPGVATAFAHDAAEALPADLDDERQGLIALERITGFMHGLPESSYRSGPEPEVSGQGDGARMLAATLCYELLRVGEDRERAVELARFALAGDRLVAVDTGLLWIVAANVLLLADEDVGDFWDRVLARAYATGGLFAVLSVNLWRGFNQGRQGHLDDALQSLVDGTEQQRMWGLSAVTSTYAAAFTLDVLVDRGDLAAAEGALDEARNLPWVGEGGRLVRESAARLLLALGRAEEALAELTIPAASAEVRNPAWARWRGLKAQALAATGRTDEALALADEEVALLRRWGAPSALGVSLRIRGELRQSAGVADLREAVDLLTGTRAVLELARARVALACAPGVPDAEAVPLLEAALHAARACGARGVAAEAVAALARRGRSDAGSGDAQTGLTSRQRRVIELTAAGLDPHQVAQRLFLTPGTVRGVLESMTSGAR